MAVVPFLALTDAFDPDDDELDDDEEPDDDEADDDRGDDEFTCTFLPFLTATGDFFSGSSHLFLLLFFSRLISSSLLRMSSVLFVSGAVSFGGSNGSLDVVTFCDGGAAAAAAAVALVKRLMWDTVRWAGSLFRWGPVAVELIRRCLLTCFPEKERDFADDDVRALSADFMSFWWNS